MCGVTIDVFTKFRKEKLFNYTRLLIQVAHTSEKLQFPRTKKERDGRPNCDWFMLVHVIVLVNLKQEVLYSQLCVDILRQISERKEFQILFKYLREITALMRI